MRPSNGGRQPERPGEGALSEYRLVFMDLRETHDEVTAENVEATYRGISPTMASRLAPGDEFGELYPRERFFVQVNFPQGITRQEVVNVLRWIGSHADDGRVDGWFETWERQRIQAAGVRVDFFPPLVDAAMNRLMAEGQRLEAECPSVDADTVPDGVPKAAPEPKRPRRKTAAGRRPRYSIVRRKRHAELVIRGGHGKGEVRAVAKIDLDDVERVSRHSWHVTGSGEFLCIETDSGTVGDAPRVRSQLHRFVFGAAPGEAVGFRNGDRMDFRKANLMIGPGNRKVYKNNTSGFRGVTLDKSTGKYAAAVGKARLGLYATPEEAAAVARAERERRGWVEADSAPKPPSKPAVPE